MIQDDGPRKLRAVEGAAAGPDATDFVERYGEGDLIEGKYRLGRLLGEGGMGEVWLAHNETLDIDVAIKLIRADLDQTDIEDRLLREARAAARLGHPAIVRVYDFGTTERGHPFIVMELLSGQDLHTALADRGRLSAGKAVRTLLPIAHALREAHGKGIVHRDLKPENIFLQLTDDGAMQPKLVDFGVAKLDRTKGIRLTQTGALLGSPLYMSPEQARGDDVDHRADIWAFCVVLYEAITGRTPFEGKNYNAVMYAIVANAPPPTTSLGAGDVALWEIIARGLQKDPDRRWQSMQDLGAALALWLASKGISEDITGASLDSLWLHRGNAADALASVMPPGDPVARPSVLDSLKATRIIVRKSVSRRAIWITAAVAGSVGVLLATFHTLKNAESTEAPATAAGEPAAVVEQAAPPAPEPAEPPAPEEPAAGAASETEPAETAAAPEPSVAKPAAPRVKPRRPVLVRKKLAAPSAGKLKDPFQ